jgi:twitching motility protein PilU
MEVDQANQFVTDLLRLMLSRKGSDLFLTAEFPPAIKIDGRVTKVSPEPLTAQHTVQLARSLMNDRQAADFERTKECNFAISPSGLGRFRVNAFIQQGRVGLVLRTIPSELPSIDSLQLPAIMKEVVLSQRGLVILVGGTGSGKSTSLAAMLDWRNGQSQGHIITIEDPIEFVHPHKNCIVTQREIGLDTDDWAVALKNALRQAPDVIMMGEIRDRETMEHAIAFAETGHLCLATLHANSTNQALDRIVNFFPEERRTQLLMDLSLNMRAFISQRLLPREAGRGRVAAVEILLNSPLVADLIFKGEVTEIKELMKRSRELGMQTFDQALFDLYESGQVSYDDVLRNADSVNDLRLQIKLNSQRSRERNLAKGTEHLRVEMTEEEVRGRGVLGLDQPLGDARAHPRHGHPALLARTARRGRGRRLRRRRDCWI